MLIYGSQEYVYMPMVKFTTAYREFCGASKRNPPPWSESYCDAELRLKDAVIVRRQLLKKYPRGTANFLRSGVQGWVLGVDLRPKAQSPKEPEYVPPPPPMEVANRDNWWNNLPHVAVIVPEQVVAPAPGAECCTLTMK
jgi:hypothetical protein